MKIYTHNSGSGERSYWLRSLFVPFARCQDKTLLEQVQSGATWLDIRLRKRGDKWVLAHGIWEGNDCADYLLDDVNNWARTFNKKILISIIYEGKIKDDDVKEFLEYADAINSLTNLQVINVRDKKTWKILKNYQDEPKYEARFDILNKQHGYRYLLPIPRLWWWLRKNDNKTTDDIYMQVDFL